MTRPRVLMGVLVYNGRDFVPRCLESSARLRDTSDADVQTLVLDDASPDESFTHDLVTLSAKLDIEYYRTPRNLGIPRNMTLAMLTAVDQGYDYVVIANSDAIFASNLVDGMIEAARRHPAAGSVTSFGNDVSIFKLANDDGERWLGTMEQVDEVSAILGNEFVGESIEIPTGVGFCLMIPTALIRDIGTMDPLYGRGYCEEVDWCLRSHAAGYRSLLAPGVFSYHIGSATNRDAGLLAEHTTVWAHERMVDLRYPNYRHEVDTFLASGQLGRTQQRAFDAIVTHAARTHGWDVVYSSFPVEEIPTDGAVHVRVSSDGSVHATCRGFSSPLTLAAEYGVLRTRMGRDADTVVVRDVSPGARVFTRDASRAGVPLHNEAMYPERV